MDPIHVDFTKGFPGKKSDGENVVVIPPEKATLKRVIAIIMTLVIGAIAYYFMLPALNFKATELYIFFGLLCFVYIGVTMLLTKAFMKPEYAPYVRQRSKIPFIIIAALIAVCIIGWLFGAVIFRAKAYSRIITVESGDFSEDVANIDFSSVPRLDSDAANAIATRTLGDLSDMVSQFAISYESTQINYKNLPVRVTPLEYGDIFKWFKNTKNGLPAYIIVDMTTQEGKLIRLENGMKYSTAEHFSHYLMRVLRFKYPTYMFDSPNFEINEEGKPFWIVPIIDKTIGLFGGTDVIGAAVVDACTGETAVIATGDSSKTKLKTAYTVNDEQWQWIDRVYSATLVNEQFNYYGRYSGGFFNSIFGQQDVKVTSAGYNYLALNDDVYMYTGVTSVVSDQSIIGFTLINQRTKEAKFYLVSGALETSAQTSAEGKVQQYEYTATFPLLLNISGEPTYFIALKDSSSYVKMYSMVNVKQATVVAIGASLSECLENYAAELKSNGIGVDIDVDAISESENQPVQEEKTTTTITGVVSDIRSQVVSGETVYYIQISSLDTYYSVKASVYEQAVILNKGDKVTIEYKKDAKGDIITAVSVKLEKTKAKEKDKD
ncbi:MAG: CvpA family protein [Clostridiales bacterium]|nr:CvpA family protein [Clostridiales bacterium]